MLARRPRLILPELLHALGLPSGDEQLLGLPGGRALVLGRRRHAVLQKPLLRGLHSFTFQLNLRTVFGIGGARRGCIARVRGVLGGV